jgi:DNA-binding transcriptional MerR regulator
MLTVGRVARQHGLSRSALLYYDRIGLLRPTGRSEGNYRLYAPADLERLGRIVRYREAGLPLAGIRQVLAGQPFNPEVGRVLEERLAGINDEIAALRRQQQLIVRGLRCCEAPDLPTTTCVAGTSSSSGTRRRRTRISSSRSASMPPGSARSAAGRGSGGVRATGPEGP